MGFGAQGPGVTEPKRRCIRVKCRPRRLEVTSLRCPRSLTLGRLSGSGGRRRRSAVSRPAVGPVVSHDNAAPSPGNLDRPLELNRELRRFPTKPSKVGILGGPYLGHLGHPHGLPPVWPRDFKTRRSSPEPLSAAIRHCDLTSSKLLPRSLARAPRRETDRWHPRAVAQRKGQGRCGRHSRSGPNEHRQMPPRTPPG